MPEGKLRLAVLTPFLGGEYYASVLGGITRAAAEYGATVITIQTVTDLDSRSVASASWHGDRGHPAPFNLPTAWSLVDGFIVIGPAVTRSYLRRLRARVAPTIVVGQRSTGDEGRAVMTDNDSGIQAAVGHLVGHGHRRIAFAGFLDGLEERQRHQAYRKALSHHGLAAPPEWVFDAPDTRVSGGRTAAALMLQAGLPSTAVLASADATARGIIEGLVAAGCDLPGQQAVIGFGDLEDSVYTRPALTTVRHSATRMGGMAVHELMRAVHNGATPAGLDRGPIHRVPTTLVVRDSCGCDRTTSRPESSDRDAADRLFAMVEPWIGSTDDANTVRTHLAILAGAVAGRRPAPTHESLTSILENLVDVTGRAGLLLDLADAIRVVSARSSPVAESLVVDILRTHGQIKHRFAMSLVEELNSQHEVASTLLRGREADPRQLDWLARTNARSGCLGLWTAGGPPAEDDPAANVDVVLDLVGAFRWDAAPREPDSDGPCAQTVVTNFPPAALVDLARSERTEMAAVIPVVLGNRDWGLLAEIKPIRLDDVDKTNQCATLLTIALDEDQDFRELQQQERELRAAAMHDHLTGLPNRNLVLNRISQALHRTKTEHNHRFAVMFLDIDRFKAINDTLGHPAGDHVLIEVAARLRSTLRPADTAARIGGDEFLVLIDGFADPDLPARIADRLERDLARPTRFCDQEISITASVGLVLSGPSHRNANDIVRDADRAMYAMKAARRG